MFLTCGDATIGARIVAVIGLMTSVVVTVQLTTEIMLGTGRGRVAALLGLSLDEFGSRQRHAPHHDGHPSDMVQPHHMAFDHEVLVGFLAFAALYGLACALLAYASIVQWLRWGALPWLLLHALCVASQAARLVVQVSEGLHGQEEGHLVLSVRPAEPAEEVLLLLHRDEERERQRHFASIATALSTLQLLACVYMWLVVLVAQRDWSASRKPYRPAPALGDEGYDLTEVTTTTSLDDCKYEILGSAARAEEAKSRS